MVHRGHHGAVSCSPDGEGPLQSLSVCNFFAYTQNIVRRIGPSKKRVRDGYPGRGLHGPKVIHDALYGFASFEKLLAVACLQVYLIGSHDETDGEQRALSFGHTTSTRMMHVYNPAVPTASAGSSLGARLGELGEA